MTTVAIDPVTRIEGHLSVKTEVEGGRIEAEHGHAVGSRSSGHHAAATRRAVVASGPPIAAASALGGDPPRTASCCLQPPALQTERDREARIHGP